MQIYWLTILFEQFVFFALKDFLNFIHDLKSYTMLSETVET